MVFVKGARRDRQKPDLFHVEAEFCIGRRGEEGGWTLGRGCVHVHAQRVRPNTETRVKTRARKGWEAWRETDSWKGKGERVGRHQTPHPEAWGASKVKGVGSRLHGYGCARREHTFLTAVAGVVETAGQEEEGQGAGARRWVGGGVFFSVCDGVAC